MIRVCPKRDAVCPHGMSCPYVIDQYDCAAEGRQAMSEAPPEGWEAAHDADFPMHAGDYDRPVARGYRNGWNARAELKPGPAPGGEGDWVLVREALFEAWGYDDALNAKVIAARTALDRLAAAPPPPGES